MASATSRPDASAYGQVLSRLRKVTRHSWGWKALCPAHDDQNQSLSIKVGDTGNLLCKCHACGATIESIARAMGLELKEFFPPEERASRNGSRMNGQQQQSRPKIIATYDYTDERGEVLYQAVRFEPKDFRQRKPDGRGGWVWSLEGVRRVLYRLPEVLGSGDRLVFVVEGERDVASLSKLGFIATTNSGGAGKWKPGTPEGESYAAALKGRHVVIIPDDDTPGYEHARLVAETIRNTAASVRVLKLFDAGQKQDVSDWLDYGHTADELKQLIKDCAPVSPPEAARQPSANHCTQNPAGREQVIAAADVLRARAEKLDPTDWLYFARGVLHELEGKIQRERPA